MALISDVHGNLPALETVLAEIEAVGVDAVWCLGDLVGYGAQPDECVARAREACDLCLVGNHDLVVIDKLSASDFSPAAAAAALWTRERIGEEAAGFLAGLEPAELRGEIALYHGSPRDPVWEYLLSPLQADASMDVMDARVGAVGHSHVALAFERRGDHATGQQMPGGTEADISAGEWLLNPGAVGQPRDGDPRAAWLLLDLEHSTASWRRAEYPIDRAAAAIRDADLPGALADRLYYGQ